MPDQTPTNNLGPKDKEAVFRLRLAKEQKLATFGRRLEQEKSGKLRLPSGISDPYPAAPFVDRTVVSAMEGDKKGITAFLEHKYGKGSVSQDKRGFLVEVGGKKMRVSTGGLAGAVAETPEAIGGVAGGVAGAGTGGPVGAIAGAAAGSMAGRSLKEAGLAAYRAKAGLPGKEPGEVIKSVERAGEAGAMGEAGVRGAGRIVRGPLPKWLTGATPESQALTKRFMEGGGKPPVGSALPHMKFFQRQIKKAEILTGQDTGTTRKNIEYLQRRASEILDKAGVTGLAKDQAVARMVSSDSAIDLQTTGKLIQNTIRSSGVQAMTKGTKAGAYFDILVQPGRTPEDAVEWLLAKGQTDRLGRFVKIMGKNSVVVQAVQQQALKGILYDSLERSARDGGEGLYNALKVYTDKQKKLLLPNGIDKDLVLLAKEMKFAFPKPQELGMPGWTTGSEFEKRFYTRWYYQGTSALTRMILQHPQLVTRLATGFRSGAKTAAASRLAMRTIFQESALNIIGTPPEEAQGSPAAAQPNLRSGVIRREAPAP